MKKIIATILAIMMIVGFGYLYLYIFWLRPFNEHPDEPTGFILIAIVVLHIIVFAIAWLLEKVFDFITNNL